MNKSKNTQFNIKTKKIKYTDFLKINDFCNYLIDYSYLLTSVVKKGKEDLNFFTLELVILISKANNL